MLYNLCILYVTNEQFMGHHGNNNLKHRFKTKQKTRAKGVTRTSRKGGSNKVLISLKQKRQMNSVVEVIVLLSSHEPRDLNKNCKMTKYAKALLLL